MGFTCIVCGERATCFLHGQHVCTGCRKSADADEDRSEALARHVERLMARQELARRYPSLARKMRGPAPITALSGATKD